MANKVVRLRDLMALIPKGTKVFIFRGGQDVTQKKESIVRKLLAIFNAPEPPDDLDALRVEAVIPYIGGIEIRVKEGRR